ncbi:hypothetical protein [Mycobacterium sp. MAA66]|uniref:hypothetical protein n=1 Tax=Mycobacterium sp. MAA66 TaxID=3156297 RepID=UPI0035145C63
MYDAGACVLLSTDTQLLSQSNGLAERRDIEATVDGGTPACDARRASTMLPAQALALVHRGVVVQGKRADLAVLAAGPKPDTRNTRRTERVDLSGITVDWKASRAQWI